MRTLLIALFVLGLTSGAAMLGLQAAQSLGAIAGRLAGF